MKDLIDMAEPRGLKYMQVLSGKFTALGRFIAKSANQALPLFQAFKGALTKIIYVGIHKWKVCQAT